MDSLDLGIEQTLIETHTICSVAGADYCLETQTTTMANINLITFLISLLPFIVFVLIIRAFKRK